MQIQSNALNKKHLHKQPHRGAAVQPIACPRSGQAMVEFVVAIVAIMIVVGGILTIANLQRADAKSMLDATTEAVEDSMGNSISSNFSPIKDWDDGADGYEQTKDDRAQKGNFSNVRDKITGHAVPNDDWSAFDRADGGSVIYDEIERLDASGGSTIVGLVEGKSTEVAEIPKAIQQILGFPAEVEIENEVWMPKTEGLY